MLIHFKYSSTIMFMSFMKGSLILKNFISLSAAEIISKIISVITFAYLARILSPGGFGVIGFAAAYISYFILIVDFGFELYGTREIAKNKEDSNRLVNSIISIRIILSLFVFAILSVSSFVFVKDSLNRLAVVIAGLNLFVTAFSMNWYFYGIQKMKYVSIRQILTSIINLILIVLFVKNKDDVLLAIFISGLAGLINSLWLLVIYNRSFGKFLLQIDSGFIGKIIKDAAPLMLSSIMITIYYNLDMVILGFMKTEQEVGIYSAAVKIFLIGNVSYNLLLKSFFPGLSKNEFNMAKDFFKTFKSYYFSMISFGIITSISVYFLSNDIILVLYGHAYSSSVLPLKILAANSMVVCINMIFCNPLIAINRQKEYLIVVTIGAVSNVILNFILIPLYSYTGAALATLLSEMLVFISVLFVQKNIMLGYKFAV